MHAVCRRKSMQGCQVLQTTSERLEHNADMKEGKQDIRGGGGRIWERGNWEEEKTGSGREEDN